MAFGSKRLSSEYFRKRDTTEPSRGRVEERAFNHRKNCMWFSVDTVTGLAVAVHFQDAYTNSTLAVLEQLEPGEAVLVVSETGWDSLERAHRDAVVGDLDFRLPLADLAEVAYLLVTAERIYVFDGSPPRDPHPLVTQLQSRAAFLALLD
ncbi:hypothetical protein EBS80_00480 [bacterium]|nr:hypothetical protein [bacterium]